MKLQYLLFALCLGFSACSSSTDPDDTDGDSDQTDSDGADVDNGDVDGDGDGSPTDNGPGDTDVQCTAYTMRCTAPNSIERCLPDGTWELLGPCDQGVCSNGQCVGVCTIGATGCCMGYADGEISCTYNTVEECVGENCLAHPTHGPIMEVFVGVCSTEGRWIKETGCEVCTSNPSTQTGIAHCEYCNATPTCSDQDGCLSPCQ